MSDPFANIPLVTPLDADQLQSVGVPAGWAFGLADRVRFHELDALNHVNNVAYLRWFESLRIPYFQDYGLSSYASDDDPQVVVASNSARYFKPMFLGESYVVTGRTKSFRNNSFVMEFGCWVTGELRCSGECLVVSLEHDGKTKRALQAHVTEAFLSRDGALCET